MASNTENKITELLAPVLEKMGFDLLWLEIKSNILTIYAENPKTAKLTLDECTKISREISPILEVEDPIDGAYRLEVSSAGIDRPLFKPSDYDRYHDLEVKVELSSIIEGQKKFRGFIRENNDQLVTIETDQGNYDLPHSDIIKCKLVMNEELIKETKKRFGIANNNEQPETLEINA
ncbi:MAG: ribosome maturation factor RimP [Pseudomonadota bacterium]